eukprot:scaffold102_cov340-Pavlova_lutheri.AAC.19
MKTGMILALKVRHRTRNSLSAVFGSTDSFGCHPSFRCISGSSPAGLPEDVLHGRRTSLYLVCAGSITLPWVDYWHPPDTGYLAC